MVPQGMLLLINIRDIVLLVNKTVSVECHHSSHPYHLCCNLLHIVQEENVPDLRLQGLEMSSNHGHVQLGIAVYMNTRRDLVLPGCRADVRISFPRREQMLQSRISVFQELDEEVCGLIKAIQIMNHYIQVKSQSKHLTCMEWRVKIN